MNFEAKITLNHGQMQAEICLAFFIIYLSVFVSISIIWLHYWDNIYQPFFSAQAHMDSSSPLSQSSVPSHTFSNGISVSSLS